MNIARHLPLLAESAPARTAVRVCKRTGSSLTYRSITFAELECLSNRYANALTMGGVTSKMRTLLMVRQGFDFIGLVFALFKIGAVPVLIDPGMGVGRFLDCIRTVNLDAFVGIPLAHVVRTLRPGPFAAVKSFITVGRRWFWGGPTLAQLTRSASVQFAAAQLAAGDTAAILFTSGSTGPAKGVVYEHGMFDAQVRMIQTTYGIQPGEVDLPTFPLFALFSVAMGMTIVLPDMDPSHPARVNPANIVDAIREQNATNTFGSPALWKRVADYCVNRGITLPTLRRILIAGAPVPPPVIEQLHRVLSPDADVHTPYGATESLPVSTISGSEVVARPSITGIRSVHPDTPPTASLTRRGAGTCVGLPVESTDVTILRISDGTIEELTDNLLAIDGDVGEICVTGPSVTREYFGLPRANAISKIRECDTVWHRIGDVGYFDEFGRLWFCGRKAHRIQTSAGTLFTECIEAIFNQHPAVARCALVGVGPVPAQTPILVVELKPGQPRRGPKSHTLAAEILEMAQAVENHARSDPSSGCRPTAIAHGQTALFNAQVNRQQSHVLFHRSLPVDIRHNAKINREKLAVWAAKSIQGL